VFRAVVDEVGKAAVVSKQVLVKAVQLGRIASHTAQAEAKRGAAQQRQHLARRSWKPTELPDWLDEEAYRTRIQSALIGLGVSTVASRLGISESYAVNIRAGKRQPHPRHWNTLAQLIFGKR